MCSLQNRCRIRSKCWEKIVIIEKIKVTYFDDGDEFGEKTETIYFKCALSQVCQHLFLKKRLLVDHELHLLLQTFCALEYYAL